MKNAKYNVRRLGLLLSMLLVSCEASAHWDDSLTIYLSNVSCSLVTKVSGLETSIVPQDIHGLYELTANSTQDTKSSLTDDVPTTYYNCWTNNEQNLVIAEITGTFANVDPYAIFNHLDSGVTITVDGNNFPCSVRWTIATVDSLGFRWCKFLKNTSHWGGKDGYNAWKIEDPDTFNIDKSWKTINLQEREYAYFWDSWSDAVGLTIYHRSY